MRRTTEIRSTERERERSDRDLKMKVQIRWNSLTHVPPINKIRISMYGTNGSRLAIALAASSVPVSLFRSVERSARINFSDLDLLWTAAPSCLPFLDFHYRDADLWDVLDPERGTQALPFEQLWMRVFYRYGNLDYWIPYPIPDDKIGVRRFLRCITDGRWKLQLRFAQSARELVNGVEPQMAEQRLRERMQIILRSLPPAELSRIAKSLPRLRSPGGAIVQLSDHQVRRCLRGISRSIRHGRFMARLEMAAQDVADDPFQSDALWKQMVCELNFAISALNWFNSHLNNPFIQITPEGLKRHNDRHDKLDQYRRFDILGHDQGFDLEPDVEVRSRDRVEFLKRSALERPEALRLIDIDATCGALGGGVVHLVEYEDGMGFSAISHTYGMDVYQMFDCQCCTVFMMCTDALQGRARIGPCPHHERVSRELKQKRDEVVGDIVRMCGWLKEAGVRYAWHDGVCIAQHDEEEVKASIQRMGWVYAYAEEAIVFLHYVGKPMAILRNVDLMVDWDLYGLTPRWQLRAWTFQESALAAKRRYCIRVGSPLFGQCNRVEEMERMVEGWYDDETSSIRVVEERTFLEIYWDAERSLEVCLDRSWLDLAAEYKGIAMDVDYPRLVLLYPKICSCLKPFYWKNGLRGLRSTMRSASSRSRFSSTATTLEAISDRESKHVGDRINCILALAGVKGLIVPKDFEYDPKVDVDSMHDWTLKFFSMQDQKRLEAALYAVNYRTPPKIKRSWVPRLEWRLESPADGRFQELLGAGMRYLEYKVVGDRKLQLLGDMVCVKANFRFNNAAKARVRRVANISGCGWATSTSSSSLDDVSALDGGVCAASTSSSSSDDVSALGGHGGVFATSTSSSLSAAAAAAAAELRDCLDCLSRLTSYLTITASGGQTTGAPPSEFSFDSAATAFRQYVHSLGPDAQQSSLSHSAADLWRTYADILCAEAVQTMIMDDLGMAQPVHGWNVLERIGRDLEAAAGMSMELRPGPDENFEATWAADAGCGFGTLVSPYAWDEARDAFSAYLVVPRLYRGEIGWWPILMVMGESIESGCTVDKIGVMQPTNLFRACFHHFVDKQPGNAIHLDNLLIN